MKKRPEVDLRGGLNVLVYLRTIQAEMCCCYLDKQHLRIELVESVSRPK